MHSFREPLDLCVGREGDAHVARSGLDKHGLSRSDHTLQMQPYFSALLKI